MMDLERSPDWSELLSQYISESRGKAFEYGSNDCCTFSCGAVQAMTGQDPMEEFRGKYCDLKSYLRMLRERGYSSLSDIFDEKFPKIEVHRARRGDLVGFRGSFGVSVGGRALFVGESDLELVPRPDWDASWGIGHG